MFAVFMFVLSVFTVPVVKESMLEVAMAGELVSENRESPMLEESSLQEFVLEKSKIVSGIQGIQKQRL